MPKEVLAATAVCEGKNVRSGWYRMAQLDAQRDEEENNDQMYLFSDRCCDGNKNQE
jgi:hypothetical protein